MKNETLERLIKKYYNEALLYVFSFCHNRALAEDIVQEAFMRAFRSIDEEKDGFKFWLFKVSRNCYFDYLRKQKHLSDVEVEIVDDSDLVDSLIKKDEYKALYGAISLLKDSYREVVRLFYFDGMSVKEIADITDSSVDNVKVQLYRARIKLKELLEVEL